MKNDHRYIVVVGARQHNLKNVTVAIKRDALTVITGPSGSGKSTLAMDVLYAEGQRRYLESLSSYARQFIGMPDKPDVDRIEGLCPSIAVDQKTVGSNPRSTVGTITEIYDYLRVLFARIGVPHCHCCGRKIEPVSPATVIEHVYERFAGKMIMISAPIAIERKGEFVADILHLVGQGYKHFMIDGKRMSFATHAQVVAARLAKTRKHTIDVIIDAADVIAEEKSRIAEAVERAFGLSLRLCRITYEEEAVLFSTDRMCVACGESFPDLEPRLFSFNSPLGACSTCHGLGTVVALEHDWGSGYKQYVWSDQPCQACHGKRLSPQALSVLVGGKSIYDITNLPVSKALTFLKALNLTTEEQVISQRLREEIIGRYGFLHDVGLTYVTLSRASRTLSGGEGQRVRLATQLGSQLSGILYVLDEPSIGLHQRDNDRLIATLCALRDRGNTVLVVEHDSDTMASADDLIDMGPGAGVHGGYLVAQGTPAEVAANPDSLTGAYLSGRRSITRTTALRMPQKFMTIHDAHTNNLKHITVAIPLNVLCVISGVSGSGKSSLIMHELVPQLQRALNTSARVKPEAVGNLSGLEGLRHAVVIDQSPIGRTSRSNPATYLGIFDEIRKLFASLPESKARGYTASRYSFNLREGRCAECEGDGTIKISMQFLSDVIMTCTSCDGKRYNKQTLEISFKDKSIADVLAMTAAQAVEFFAAHKPLAKKLQLMCEVGLDYLTLGQSSTTLSGGEAQRIKLADELAKRGSDTVYVLDEPTTGLHSSDIEKLLHVFDGLVAKGNSVIVIEHNLDVLKVADYIIDMGVEGGDEGGMVVVAGTPHEVAACQASHTGRYLRKILSSKE
jgi:excinuclease ABC subunit A